MSIAQGNGKIQTVIIEKIIPGGEGIFRVDGRAGMVAGVLPGEEVEVTLPPRERGMLRGQLVRIVTPSQHRIQPPCPYAGTCGGCDWQHMPYELQLQQKELILRENLSRLAGSASEEISITVHRSEPWGYRSRVQVHQDSAGAWGFHQRGSNTVVPVEHCMVATEGINGEIRRLQEESSTPTTEGARQLLVDEADGSEETVRCTVGDVEIVFDRRSFFQSNRPMLGELGNLLHQAVMEAKPDTVMDLYAGAGVLSALALREATTVRRLIAVEQDPRNSAYIHQNLSQSEIPREHITVHTLPLEQGLSHVPRRSPALVIVDPPRNGLSVPVRRWLLRSQVSRICYVSCDSASFARDLGQLHERFSVKELHLLDFYPQTSQIETCAILERRGTE